MRRSLHEICFDLAIQANFTATILAVGSETKRVLKKTTVPNWQVKLINFALIYNAKILIP